MAGQWNSEGIIRVGALAAACSFAPVPAARGGTLYVNAALSTGANDGSSWSNAFRGRLGVQNALAAAPAGQSTEVWIAAGDYAPGPAGASPLSAFVLRDGVSLLGGFTGVETLASQRNPDANPTILSGDILGNDGNSGPGIDNVFHVVRAVGVGPTAVLDGLIIERGYADSPVTNPPPDISNGAGILVRDASPVIRRCVIRSNRASTLGGGIDCDHSNPLIEDCAFHSNQAFFGCGIANHGAGTVTVRRCRFVEPAPVGFAMRGGGISSGDLGVNPGSPSDHAVIEDCTFTLPSVPFIAGDGLGVHVGAGSAEIRRCRFIGNTSVGGGGGVSCAGEVSIDRCLFVGNEGNFDGGAAIYCSGGHTAVSNSVIAGNDRHGFNTIFMQNGTAFDLVNCTLFDNGGTDAFRRLIIVGNASSFNARNCIIRANKSSDGDANAVILAQGQPVRFDSSCVQGWSGQYPGAGSFASDPLFASPAGPDGVTGTTDDDLSLAPGSPCIDRGDNTLAPPGTLDLAGNPRFRDDPAAPNLGVGPGPMIDLGALERVPPCPTDINHDGVMNTADLLILLGSFGQSVPPGTGGDITGNGTVTTADLTALLGVFGQSCP